MTCRSWPGSSSRSPSWWSRFDLLVDVAYVSAQSPGSDPVVSAPWSPRAGRLAGAAASLSGVNPALLRRLMRRPVSSGLLRLPHRAHRDRHRGPIAMPGSTRRRWQPVAASQLPELRRTCSVPTRSAATCWSGSSSAPAHDGRHRRGAGRRARARGAARARLRLSRAGGDRSSPGSPTWPSRSRPW